MTLSSTEFEAVPATHIGYGDTVFDQWGNEAMVQSASMETDWVDGAPVYAMRIALGSGATFYVSPVVAVLRRRR